MSKNLIDNISCPAEAIPGFEVRRNPKRQGPVNILKQCEAKRSIHELIELSPTDHENVQIVSSGCERCGRSVIVEFKSEK